MRLSDTSLISPSSKVLNWSRSALLLALFTITEASGDALCHEMTKMQDFLWKVMPKKARGKSHGKLQVPKVICSWARALQRHFLATNVSSISETASAILMMKELPWKPESVMLHQLTIYNASLSEEKAKWAHNADKQRGGCLDSNLSAACFHSHQKHDAVYKAEMPDKAVAKIVFASN